MSPSQTASQNLNPKPRRRGGRSASMAVDTRSETRYGHVRRRGQASETAVEAPGDWRDWLIPGAVVGCLATIMLYHHVTLIDAISRLF